MRVLIQRVSRAEVHVGGRLHGSIGKGLLVLVGIGNDDGDEDCTWLAAKIAGLRIFDDEQGVMNLDAGQAGGEIMAISQFTLHAMCRRGNRPSWVRAAGEAVSKPLYERFVKALEEAAERSIETGVFGADMQVESVNDGPVTIWIDSKNRDY